MKLERNDTVVMVAFHETEKCRAALTCASIKQVGMYSKDPKRKCWYADIWTVACLFLNDDKIDNQRCSQLRILKSPYNKAGQAVLWKRNYFLRFRLGKSFGSGFKSRSRSRPFFSTVFKIIVFFLQNLVFLDRSSIVCPATCHLIHRLFCFYDFCEFCLSI